MSSGYVAQSEQFEQMAWLVVIGHSGRSVVKVMLDQFYRRFDQSGEGPINIRYDFRMGSQGMVSLELGFLGI